jgi:hypothetical protein
VNWDAIGAIAELLGAVGVIASLLYLAVQVRQNTRQTRLAAQQATVQELGVALRAQAQDREWAELLSRALEDIENLDKVEKVQFLSHVGSILRLYESAYLHFKEGTLDSKFWQGFERAIADVIGYPGIQAAIALRRHHVNEDFAIHLDHLAASTTPMPIFAESDPGEDTPTA